MGCSMLSSIINLSLRPWHIAAIVVLGIFVAMTRNAPGAISGLDLIAYESAFDLFIRGGDPYSYVDMFVRQKEWMVQRDAPVMVWNPPSMFILFWPLLHVAPNIAPGVSTMASLCCGLALAFLGFHAVTTYRLKGVPLIPFIVTALLLPPFVEEIAIGQNTSWVALPVALGCYLVALQGWSWTAGLLLSWAICKPHDFFSAISSGRD